jgi:hypothetical protein
MRCESFVDCEGVRRSRRDRGESARCCKDSWMCRKLGKLDCRRMKILVER